MELPEPGARMPQLGGADHNNAGELMRHEVRDPIVAVTSRHSRSTSTPASGSRRRGIVARMVLRKSMTVIARFGVM